MSINCIYPDLWTPTANRLQVLTVIKQRVYQMTFRNVYKFKKWLVKSGLIWSKNYRYCSAVNECRKRLLVCVRTMHPYFKQFLINCHVLLKHFELVLIQLQMVKISCKLLIIWVNYEKNKKGSFFMKHRVVVQLMLLLQ